MIEFVEECRQEWRRLGVPDPIANEMAADLTADIEEAEGEGGSAEDVLGNSLFDPRRFAAAWAGARGVTAPTPPSAQFIPSTPSTATATVRPRWQWSVLVAGLTFLTTLFAVAAALAFGHRSAAVAAPVSRFVAGPGSVAPFSSGSAGTPSRIFVPGPILTVQSDGHLQLLVVIAFLLAAVGLVLAALYVLLWSRRRLPAPARKTGLPQ